MHLSTFLATPVNPKEAKGAPWSPPWLVKYVRFHVFSAPGTTNCNKNMCFGHFDPPKRPLGARGQKLPREQSKMLSWDAFWRAEIFGKSALVHKPRTHKNANPIHTYTQTHPSLCLRAHTHIHTYTQTHPSFCLRAHTHIHTYTPTLRPSHIYTDFIDT